MAASQGLVAARLYITNDNNTDLTVTDDRKPEDLLPSNLLPVLRLGRPNLGGLVEQAVDEAVNMGRLGVGVCGNRGVTSAVKESVRRNLSKDMPDIFCHSEEFGY